MLFASILSHPRKSYKLNIYAGERKMIIKNPEEKIAASFITNALGFFRNVFGWWDYNSPYQDHRGFEGPHKVVTSYKLMNFEYNEWRLIFSAKKALETPGDFAENFLSNEFGSQFAKQYLQQVKDCYQN